MGITVRNILLEVAGETVQAQRSLHNLGDELRQLPNNKEIELRADASRAMRRIGEVEKELKKVDRTKVSPELNVEVTTALLKLETMRRELNAIGSKKYTARVEVEADRNALVQMERGLLGITRTLDRVSRPAHTFGDVLGNVAQTVKSLTPIVNGLGIILVVKLAAGLIAVAGSAAAAAGGLLALAAAAAAAFGPVLAIAIAVATRISKVLEVLKLQDNAAKQSAAKEVGGSQAAETAADQHRAAVERVADAHEAVERAAEEVARATVQAYREMEDAAERLTDAIRGVEDAQLNLDESRHQLKEAKLALEQFSESLGLSQDLFKKFTDVDVAFNAGDLSKALAGTDTSKEDQLDLEGLILDVRRAKQSEKDATDQLSDSERELKRAREDNAAFLRDGIGASQGYVSALRAQRDATRNLKRAQADLASGAGGLSTATANAEVAAGKLTKTELALLEAIKKVRRNLRGFFADVTDPIISSITEAIGRLPTLLGPMKGAFIILARSIAGVIRTLSKESVRPEFIAGWAGITSLAGRLVKIIGGRVFVSFLRIMRNLALVTLPILNNLMADFATVLEGVADDSGDLSGLERVVRVLVTSFRAWMRFIGAIVELFGQLALIVGPIGDELLGWITDAIKSFTKWLKTAEGQQEVKEFFEDTLPAVKSLLGFLFRLVKVFIRVLQVTSPLIKGFFDGLSFILDLLLFFLGILQDIVHLPIVRWALELVGSLLGFGAVLRIAGKVFALLRLFPGGLLGIAKAVGRYLLKPFIDAGRAILGLLTRLAPGIATRLVAAVTRAAAAAGRALGAVVRLGGRIVTKVWEGIKGAARILLDAGKWVLGKIRDGIVAVFGRAFDAGKGFVERVIRGARSIATRLFGLGKDLLSGLIRGFTTVGKTVFDAIKGLAKKIVDAVKDVLGIHSPSKVMQDLGRFMLEGLLKGFTSADVVGFIKDHLGGIPALAAKLAATAVDPFGFQKDALESGFKLGKGVLGGLGDLVGLASGGVITGPTRALVGEGRHDEAVVPLSKAVLRKLGNAIVAAMGVSAPGLTPAPALAGVGALNAGGTRAGVVIEKQDVHMPPTPAQGYLDPRIAAVQFTRELKRRGGS